MAQMSHPIIIEPSAEVVVNGTVRLDMPVFDDSIIDEASCLKVLAQLSVVTVQDISETGATVDLVGGCERGELANCSCAVSISHFSAYAMADIVALDQQDQNVQDQDNDNNGNDGSIGDTDGTGGSGDDGTDGSGDNNDEDTDGAAETFTLKVTSTLAGVTTSEFLANVAAFQSAVANLHSGKTAADVVVDESSVTAVDVARRRLLAAGVSVEYEVQGFATQAAAEAAARTQEENSAALVTELQSTFPTLQSVTSSTSVTDSKDNMITPPAEDSRAAPRAAWSMAWAGLVGAAACLHVRQ